MDCYTSLAAEQKATRTLSNRMLSAAAFFGVIGATLFMVDSSSMPTQQYVVSVAAAQTTHIVPQATKAKATVILNKGVAGLGKQGEVVKVAPGYFRNFLSPTKQASIATPEKLEEIRLVKEEEERAALEILNKAKKAATSLATVGKFTVKKEVGPDGQIFGSVTEQEILEVIRRQMGLDIKKTDIILPDIKKLGTFPAQVQLHPKVMGKFNVVVVKNK